MPKIDLPEFLKLVRGSLEDDDGQEVDVLLAEPIGFDPNTYSGMSSRRFGEMLGAIPKKKVVNLQINTLGGLFGEGVAMANMILARGNVNTICIGYAASMGAIIFQAGVNRAMMPGTMLVIHNPMSAPDGDADQLRAAADSLDKVKGNLVTMLAERTKNSKRKISDWMNATTSFSPEEAVENGFADKVISGAPVWNDFNPKSFFDSCRQINSRGALASASGGEGKQTPKETSTMKKVMEALAKHKVVASADLTEDQAALQVENNIASLSNASATLVEENGALKKQVTAFELARKTRVTNKVEAAVTSKLVKAERKDALILVGVRDEAELDSYLADIEDVRATSGATRRGAPPVPPVKNEGGDDKTKMETLREEMRDASPARCAEISRELRVLRGHKNLFEAPATK